MKRRKIEYYSVLIGPTRKNESLLGTGYGMGAISHSEIAELFPPVNTLLLRLPRELRGGSGKAGYEADSTSTNPCRTA